jgi:ectoine hydroxylase-related dioxygenase (phytanoyl-CoA dioxygenase family)
LGKINNSDGHTYNKKIHQKYQLDDALPIIAKAGDVLFFDARTIHGSLPNNSIEARKTILLQLYSGMDEIVPNNKHTNVQLVLRGINHNATRSSVSNIKA